MILPAVNNYNSKRSQLFVVHRTTINMEIWTETSAPLLFSLFVCRVLTTAKADSIWIFKQRRMGMSPAGVLWNEKNQLNRPFQFHSDEKRKISGLKRKCPCSSVSFCSRRAGVWTLEPSSVNLYIPFFPEGTHLTKRKIAVVAPHPPWALCCCLILHC